jgi:hypothetical protein
MFISIKIATRIALSVLLFSCTTTITTRALSDNDAKILSVSSGIVTGFITCMTLEYQLNKKISVIEQRAVRELYEAERAQMRYIVSHLLTEIDYIRTRNEIVSLIVGTIVGTAAGYGTREALKHCYPETNRDRVNRYIDNFVGGIDNFLDGIRARRG